MAMEKILIIDDDVNICELLRLYLEKEGFSTETVTANTIPATMLYAFNPKKHTTIPAWLT